MTESDFLQSASSSRVDCLCSSDWVNLLFCVLFGLLSAMLGKKGVLGLVIYEMCGDGKHLMVEERGGHESHFFRGFHS